MAEHKADILAGIEERHTRSSSPTALSLSLYLVFIAIMLEKLISHRYVVIFKHFHSDPVQFPAIIFKRQIVPCNPKAYPLSATSAGPLRL